MLTGPEVRGCRPILIHFANWKDREEVLAKSRLLRGTNIYVTEDLSRKIREHRNELNKFMREVCVSWSKVENILKGILVSIPSPSPSVKIQIMGRKVCLRCRGKTLLGVVNKLLKKSTQQCFTLLPQVHFPSKNLDFH